MARYYKTPYVDTIPNYQYQLPFQEMATALAGKQAEYDTTLAAAEELEGILPTGGYRTKDRSLEFQNKYTPEIDKIITDLTQYGDSSKGLTQIQSLAKRIKRDPEFSTLTSDAAYKQNVDKWMMDNPNAINPFIDRETGDFIQTGVGESFNPSWYKGTPYGDFTTEYQNNFDLIQPIFKDFANNFADFQTIQSPDGRTVLYGIDRSGTREEITPEHLQSYMYDSDGNPNAYISQLYQRPSEGKQYREAQYNVLMKQDYSLEDFAYDNLIANLPRIYEKSKTNYSRVKIGDSGDPNAGSKGPTSSNFFIATETTIPIKTANIPSTFTGIKTAMKDLQTIYPESIENEYNVLSSDLNEFKTLAQDKFNLNLNFDITQTGNNITDTSGSTYFGLNLSEADRIAIASNPELQIKFSDLERNIDKSNTALTQDYYNYQYYADIADKYDQLIEGSKENAKWADNYEKKYNEYLESASKLYGRQETVYHGEWIPAKPASLDDPRVIDKANQDIEEWVLKNSPENSELSQLTKTLRESVKPGSKYTVVWNYNPLKPEDKAFVNNATQVVYNKANSLLGVSDKVMYLNGAGITPEDKQFISEYFNQENIKFNSDDDEDAYKKISKQIQFVYNDELKNWQALIHVPGLSERSDSEYKDNRVAVNLTNQEMLQVAPGLTDATNLSINGTIENAMSSNLAGTYVDYNTFHQLKFKKDPLNRNRTNTDFTFTIGNNNITKTITNPNNKALFYTTFNNIEQILLNPEGTNEQKKEIITNMFKELSAIEPGFNLTTDDLISIMNSYNQILSNAKQ